MKQEFFIPATDARLVVVQRIGRVLEYRKHSYECMIPADEVEFT
jgi:hypothetical protein